MQIGKGLLLLHIDIIVLKKNSATLKLELPDLNIYPVIYTHTHTYKYHNLLLDYLSILMILPVIPVS